MLDAAQSKFEHLPKTAQTTLYLPHTLVNRMRAMARDTGMPLSKCIRLTIEAGMDAIK
jgi:predicted DNA binding CopG/RHH family protein